ncbi:hypothetical protein M5D96_004685 [Drosophila gunungcola]|uniref:Uncharacterized protein n=1 Tax=Drosophila gunungcola TaxID=103775 RepID=A0A9Q0BTA1_9MUSC|nr:hypothetical protein M5D96_004685 [Drosophila gunungcola]
MIRLESLSWRNRWSRDRSCRSDRRQIAVDGTTNGALHRALRLAVLIIQQCDGQRSSLAGKGK